MSDKDLSIDEIIKRAEQIKAQAEQHLAQAQKSLDEMAKTAIDEVTVDTEAVMQKVEELSNGQVRLAAGTMYGAIENLLKKKWISYLPSDDSRKKVYVISDLGKKVLSADYSRMLHMIDISKKVAALEF